MKKLALVYKSGLKVKAIAIILYRPKIVVLPLWWNLNINNIDPDENNFCKPQLKNIQFDSAV